MSGPSPPPSPLHPSFTTKMTRTHTRSRKGLHKGNHHRIVCFLNIPARSPWAKPAPSARIFAYFLLCVLWCTDSYLNSPRNLHQIESENYVREQKESHNAFYLHAGTERKHLGFGTATIYSTLTSNPDRKNKPLSGKFDRRTLIFLYLLRSGDVPQNPGPNTTRQADASLARDQPIPPQANVANTTVTTTTMDPQIKTHPQIPIKPSYIGTRGKEPLCPTEGHNAAENEGPGTPAAPSRLTGELQVINEVVRSRPRIPVKPSYIGMQVKKPLCPTKGHNAAEYDSPGIPAVPSGVTAELQVINAGFRSHPQISVKPSDIGTRGKKPLCPTEGHNPDEYDGPGTPATPSQLTGELQVINAGVRSSPQIPAKPSYIGTRHKEPSGPTEGHSAVQCDSPGTPAAPSQLTGELQLINAGVRSRPRIPVKPSDIRTQQKEPSCPTEGHSTGVGSSDPECPTAKHVQTAKAAFVIQHRAKLIQQVSRVMAIVDSVGRKVHRELYAEIQAEKTSMEKMRRLYEMLGVASTAINAEFYDALKEHEPHLVESLGPVLSPKETAKHETLALRQQQQLKSNLRRKRKKEEGNHIFIKPELCITERQSGEDSNQHEVRQIETAFNKQTGQETPIQFEDIFKPLSGQDPIRTVMTKGVAGIGKTDLTQKYIQNWVEDKSNQDINFIFPFTFRDLNSLKKDCSLEELVNTTFDIKETGICSNKESNVVFCFDGLDEFRRSLDFQNNEVLTDVTKRASVDALLTSLIKGTLLPSARIWITTRPAAADQIPIDYVDRMTELKGFTDPQKDEYFMKAFSDEHQARTITSHIQTSRSLHIMCYIPVFCWITATVLLDMLKTEVIGALPKALTEMYIHFMVFQFKQKNVKYHDGAQAQSIWNEKNNKIIMSLGKLAFEQLEKGHLNFDESDLTECGIDIKDASVYSGLFTQIFKEVRGVYKDIVFCFVHLSVQEFMAALYVYLSFVNEGVNLLSTSKWFNPFRDKSNINHLYQSAVDKALESPNGHLDLFLRFLLGLSSETNQTLLHGMMKKTGKKTQTNQKTVNYIKKKIKENPSPEKSINLFHCLNELNDHSLEKEIQENLSSGSLSTKKLSPAQWSALVFMLLSSEKELDVFDLKKYSGSEEALLRLLPVVKASKRALLSGCNLSKRCCKMLSTVLSSSSSWLKELDLSNNNLLDSGVKLIADGLGSSQCSLETLRLSGCMVSEVGCSYLATALRLNSHLKVLDLSFNHPGDGVELLSALPLETLSVDHGGECRLHPLKKYSCSLSLDVNTAHNDLSLSEEDRKVTGTGQHQGYPAHPERFTSQGQVLSKESLCEGGRSYWEVEWCGGLVRIAVCYKDINRQGDESWFGDNSKSWCLQCSDGSYWFRHNNVETAVSGRCPYRGRVGVYLDHSAGTLSFYSVTDTMTLLHTEHTTFTQPLYAGIVVYYDGDTAELCKMW